MSLALYVLGKVAKKKSGKSVVFCQPPPGPPPPPPCLVFLVKFSGENFFSLIFLMENRSIMPETDFFTLKNTFYTWGLFFLCTLRDPPPAPGQTTVFPDFFLLPSLEDSEDVPK